MAPMSYLKAIEGGVDAVDTTLSPLAHRNALPAIEPLIIALSGTPRDTRLNLANAISASDHVESVVAKYREYVSSGRIATTDTSVAMHQVPGGMTSNLLMQLKQLNSENRLSEIYEEIRYLRMVLGCPPLVTPISQIIGAQAVQNVLLGRFAVVSNQLVDYVCGLYGRPPAPIDAEIQKLVLKKAKRANSVVTCRPADLLQPQLERARKSISGVSDDMGDLLIAAILPAIGPGFVRNKHEKERANGAEYGRYNSPCSR